MSQLFIDSFLIKEDPQTPIYYCSKNLTYLNSAKQASFDWNNYPRLAFQKVQRYFFFVLSCFTKKLLNAIFYDQAHANILSSNNHCYD